MILTSASLLTSVLRSQRWGHVVVRVVDGKGPAARRHVRPADVVDASSGQPLHEERKVSAKRARTVKDLSGGFRRVSVMPMRHRAVGKLVADRIAARQRLSFLPGRMGSV